MARPQTVKEVSELLKNEHYQKYYEKKLEIQSRYPLKPWLFSAHSPTKGPYKPNLIAYTEEEWESWTRYKKEICDLMLEKNGDFQEFVWDIISDYDKEVQERRARGKKIKPKIEY